MPPGVVMVSSPVTPPLPSGTMANVLVTPTLPMPVVPRMPTVAVGVFSTMASGPDLASWPETKLNTPVATLSTDLPACVPGS